MKKKQFFVHTLFYTVAPKLPSISGFFILPFITPYLSLKDYGKFGLIIACYSFFLLSTTLGQSVILQNSFFEYKKNYNLVWKRSYSLMLLGAATGAILQCIILYFFLGEAMSNNYLIVAITCTISLLCSPIDTIAQVFYILREKPYAIALRAVMMSVLNIILLIVTIKHLKLGYVGLVIGFASSSFFSLLFYIYPLCIKQQIYPIWIFKKKHALEYLKTGLPLLPHYLSLSIFNTSDRMLLGFYNVNVSKIGLYSQGYGIGSNAMILINGIFSAISKTLQLSFREKSKENKLRLRMIFVFLTTGISIFLFNIALWMKEIYLLLYKKPELQIGYPVALIVLMSHMFFPLYNFGIYSLFITKNTKLISRITFTAALVNVVLNLILIPVLNIWAALLTTGFSFIFLSILILFIKEAKIQLAWIFPSISKVYISYIIYGILVTAATWFLKDYSWQIKLPVSIISCLAAGIFYYYRQFFFSQKKFISHILNKKAENIS